MRHGGGYSFSLRSKNYLKENAPQSIELPSSALWSRPAEFSDCARELGASVQSEALRATESFSLCVAARSASRNAQLHVLPRFWSFRECVHVGSRNQTREAFQTERAAEGGRAGPVPDRDVDSLRFRPRRSDSLRAAARVAQSKTFWLLLASVSGWGTALWSGAVWVAGLRAELVAVQETIGKLKPDETTKAQLQNVSDETKRCSERTAVAVRVLVGELARSRASKPARDTAAAASTGRYDSAMLRGASPAEAAAAALAPQ
jgi:hypothetical protein